MKKSKVLMGSALTFSLLLSACGANQEGKAMLEGKTFEATQGSRNEYLLTFREDGTMQVKENGNQGRTDEGEYKVSEKKNEKGYYEVTFDKLEQHAGYVDDTPDGGSWYMEEKDGNPVLRNVVSYDDDATDGKDNSIYYVEYKEKIPAHGDPTDENDVYLKEK